MSIKDKRSVVQSWVDKFGKTLIRGKVLDTLSVIRSSTEAFQNHLKWKSVQETDENSEILGVSLVSEKLPLRVFWDFPLLHTPTERFYPLSLPPQHRKTENLNWIWKISFLEHFLHSDCSEKLSMRSSKYSKPYFQPGLSSLHQSTSLHSVEVDLSPRKRAKDVFWKQLKLSEFLNFRSFLAHSLISDDTKTFLSVIIMLTLMVFKRLLWIRYFTAHQIITVQMTNALAFFWQKFWPLHTIMLRFFMLKKENLYLDGLTPKRGLW